MSVEHQSPNEKRSARPANWVAATIAACSVAFCAVGIARSYSPVPLPDDWIGIYEFSLNAQDGDLGAWWQPYLENRPTLPRILFWLDVTQFGGTQFFLVAVNLLLAALLWVLFLVFIRHRFVRKNVFFVSCMSLAATLTWMQGTNLYTGFAGSLWFMAMLLPLAAFYCLYRSINSHIWFASAAALGVASILTMAIGILALPALILASVAIGLGWRRIAVLFALFILCIAVYFSNLGLPPRLGYQPVATALYTLTFLGGPAFWSALSWIAGTAHLSSVVAGEKGLFAIGSTFQEFPAGVEIGQVLATIAGAAFVIAAIVVIWQEARSTPPDPLNRCLLGFVGYLMLAASAIALGRVHSGIGHLNEENYQTATLVAWQALIIASLRSKFSLRVAAVAVTAVFFAVLPSELRALKSYQAKHEKLINALRALEEGTATADQVAALGGPGVVPVVNRLKAIGIRLTEDTER